MPTSMDLEGIASSAELLRRAEHVDYEQPGARGDAAPADEAAPIVGAVSEDVPDRP